MSTPTPAAPPPPASPPPSKLHFMSGYDHLIQHIKRNAPDLDDTEVYTKGAEYWNMMTPRQKIQWNKHAADFWNYTKVFFLNSIPSCYTPYTMPAVNIVNRDTARYSIHPGATAMAQGATIQGATVKGATAQGVTVKGATAQGATAQGATTHCATVQGASAQGVTAQGVTAQGVTAQGAMAQGATTNCAAVQGASAQGVTAQGATAQGATAQGATAQGYKGQRATAQSYMGQRTTAQGNWAKDVRPQDYGVYEMAVTSGHFHGARAMIMSIPDKLGMESGTSFKSYLYYGNDPKPEVRRFYLEDSESYKFAPLQSIVREVYQLKSQNFSIAWKDEDGDEVVMSSDAEVKTMQSEAQDGVLKLVVRCENDIRAQKLPEAKGAPGAAETSTNQGGTPGVHHKGVVCDGCGGPVIGHRYKCISCDNYDLCAKCETAGKHSEHCFVRVPLPSMSVSLLKATIKKSRRFLKSVALASIEENKKLRRERRQSAEPNTQGKQDSQPRTTVGWMDAFTKYMEEFANIAGNVAYCPANETETTEASTSTEPRSGETNKSAPSVDEIAQDPLAFSGKHLTALQRACKYWRDNNLGDNANLAVKFFASLDPGHAFAPEMVLENGASNLTQVEKDIAEAGPAPRQEANNPEADPEPKKSPKTYQAVLSDFAKNAQIAITGQGTPESASLKDMYIERGDISELANAVNKCEVSSNASSCSEGNGYEKAEGWTVVDVENLLKDETTDPAANVEDGPQKEQEPIRQQARLYPALNAATAVFNPKESEVAPASASAAPASASAAPATPAPAPTAPAPTAPVKAAPTKLTEEEVKKAKSAAAAIAQDLRMQIAPHVEAALQQMEMMGFSNESGWLTQLLDHHDGNIAIVLDLIAPVKGANTPTAPNAPNARRK